MRIQVCKAGNCGYMEWKKEEKAVGPCGKRAVAKAGGTPLCREHAIMATYGCTFGKHESPNEFVRSLVDVEAEVEAEIREGDRIQVAGIQGKVVQYDRGEAVVDFDTGKRERLNKELMKGARRI